MVVRKRETLMDDGRRMLGLGERYSLDVFTWPGKSVDGPAAVHISENTAAGCFRLADQMVSPPTIRAIRETVLRSLATAWGFEIELRERKA